MSKKHVVDVELDFSPSEFDAAKSAVDVTNKAIELSRLNRNEAQRQQADTVIRLFAEETAKGNLEKKKNISNAITKRIADLDEMLTTQINAILHHPEFQKLEASWQGLYQLVRFAEPDTELKINVLDTTKEDILADAESAADFDDTALFKMVYEHEYGTFGGTPYGLLVSDYSFDKTQEDIETLKAISKVAAAGHTPFLGAVDPQMFDIDQYKDLHKPRDLEALFNSPGFGQWNQFRETEDSKYVALALPKMIMRSAYGGKNGIPVKEFNFKEEINSREHNDYLWGSPAWAMAQRLVESFRTYGWFSNIQGVENGGAVVGLPSHGFTDEEGNVTFKMPVETAITDRREKELDKQGFLSLVYKRGTDMAVFFGSKTTHKPPEYESDVANANAQLSVQLNYLMALSRFAHYLKVMMRDKIGTFADQGSITRYLNAWIQGYVLPSDTGSDVQKSIRPLRDASIEVIPVPGKVGAFRAVLNLKPHFHLTELTIALRLVTDLPSGGGGGGEGGEEGGGEQ